MKSFTTKSKEEKITNNLSFAQNMLIDKIETLPSESNQFFLVVL